MEVIFGKIIEGNKIGTEIGFPTINVFYDGEISGIYIGKLVTKEGGFGAAVHVGNRPTINDKNPVCEILLVKPEKVDVKIGDEVKVLLMKKIRDVKKFDKLEALKKQMELDLDAAKKWYGATCL